MRAGRFAGFVVAVGLAAIGACGKAPPPGETVASTTLPPITICYLPDGAPCPPLDAGEDGGDDAAGGDAGDAGDG
jgi:hypothetical protein